MEGLSWIEETAKQIPALVVLVYLVKHGTVHAAKVVEDFRASLASRDSLLDSMLKEFHRNQREDSVATREALKDVANAIRQVDGGQRVLLEAVRKINGAHDE